MRVPYEGSKSTSEEALSITSIVFTMFLSQKSTTTQFLTSLWVVTYTLGPKRTQREDPDRDSKSGYKTRGIF
jgi:hypothetical protein